MRCSRAEEFESYVDDPTTLEALQSLHDPPDVVVAVSEGAKESGNIACGHSPVCILLLPVVVEDLAFPVRYQNATVKTGGKLTYEAVFHHNGQFMRATARDAKVAREIQFLDLNALDRNVVVEVGRAPLDASGKAGKFSKTRVQKQVDLLTPYTKLLGDPATQQRSVALLEVTRVLGDDALPLVRTRLADPKEAAEVKTEFFHAMCYPGASPFEAPTGARDLMRAFAAAQPPAAPALAALECCERGAEPRNAGLKLSLEEARPLIEATLRAIGDAATSREFLEYSAALYLWAGGGSGADTTGDKDATAAIHAALAACRPLARRNYLAFLFDAPLSEADRRALAVDPEFAVEVHSRLDANQPEDYELLLHALATLDPKHVGRALVALNGRTEAPTPAERELLSALYVKELDPRARAGLLGRLAQSGATERSSVAALLRQRLEQATPAPGAQPAPASNDGYLPERPPERDVVRHAALAAFGSSADQRPLLRYVARYEFCEVPGSTQTTGSAARSERAARCGFEPLTVLARPEDVFALTDLARYALGLAGCRDFDAAAVRQAIDAPAPEALCSAPAPAPGK